ncbi:hypothetical protein PAHAL_2G241500 [Panicum hallii]|uniref:5'-3' DNA helicase ZGRF1-like N-terminal domain-containing protein n=1 Tax=Panicum hallii TaxID=206008 RepID=A0A2S3GZA0_9POAL|nr:hypothetical protein PAHAL_2G241500 [Panicum hallii]
MEAEPPQRWAATYTKHVKQKRKAYHDGALLLYPASGRLVLLDDAGDTLESRFLRSSEEFSPGAALSFQAHLVNVGEPEDGPARYTSSSASASAGSRTSRRAGGARARPPSSERVFPMLVSRAFVNPSKSRGCGGGGGGDGEAAGSGGAEVLDSNFQEWTALYTAQLTQKAKKYRDGFVRLVQAGPHVQQIVLLDEYGQVLGCRHLMSGESIESGKKCHFPNYLIEICEAKNQKHGGEHTSEESMVHSRQKNGGNTCNKMRLGASSTSQKFVSPQKFHGLDDTKSKVTGKPESDKVEAMAADRPGSLTEADSGFKEWNALYTTQLTQKAKKYHDGILRLMQIGSHARQIVLLDEYGEVLGNRCLKSVESIESGTKCHLPNYLVEVCELRNQTNETKHSLKDALNQTGLRNQQNTSDKTSEKCRSPKFVSPFKSQDAQKSNWESTASSNRPQVGKTTCSNLDTPQNFHVHSDLQRRKSGCNVNRGSDYSESTFDFADIHRCSATNFLPDLGKSTSSRNGDPLQFHDVQDGKSGCPNSVIRREVDKSTFGNMDDSLRTASQILSIMKPPSETRISQSSQSGQAHYSLASSEARITLDASCRRNSMVDESNKNFYGSGTSGMSHFATQLRTSVQSCLTLETLPRMNSVRGHQWGKSSGNSHPNYDHQTL